MQGPLINKYAKLTEEVDKALRKLAKVMEDSDFENQLDALTEEDEMDGCVYGDINSYLSNLAEYF